MAKRVQKLEYRAAAIALSVSQQRLADGWIGDEDTWETIAGCTYVAANALAKLSQFQRRKAKIPEPDRSARLETVLDWARGKVDPEFEDLVDTEGTQYVFRLEQATGNLHSSIFLDEPRIYHERGRNKGEAAQLWEKAFKAAYRASLVAARYANALRRRFEIPVKYDPDDFDFVGEEADPDPEGAPNDAPAVTPASSATPAQS